jgi:hypothetical protein
MTMRIAFSMDGGLASFPGLRRPITLDCDALPPRQAARLRALVERARFFSAPAPDQTSPAPDARTYTLEIEDGKECRRLRIPEPVADEDLRALIAELRQCARDQR